MSLWQFFAAIEGHVSPDGPAGNRLSKADKDRLWQKIQERRLGR